MTRTDIVKFIRSRCPLSGVYQKTVKYDEVDIIKLVKELQQSIQNKDDEITYHIEINSLLFNGKQEANLAAEILELKKQNKALFDGVTNLMDISIKFRSELEQKEIIITNMQSRIESMHKATENYPID